MENPITETATDQKISGNGSIGNNGSSGKNGLSNSQVEQAGIPYIKNQSAYGPMISFNIHDRLRMGVEASTPTASLLKDMFAPFVVDGSDQPEDEALYDLIVTGELQDLVDGSFGEVHGETEFRYNDLGIHLEATGVQVIKHGDQFRLNGRQELLVMALPLIDRIMVNRGAAMIHALTVDYLGHGICIPAWGGVGKTSTMAKLLKINGFSFMGDDWAFLSDEGDLLGYAKPMFIKPYHRPIYPHLFKKVHKPLVPVSLSKKISRMTTLVHPFITLYPQVASVVRRWSPEHMMVKPQVAFPEASFSTRAPVAAAMFIERYESSSMEIIYEEKDTHWMVSRMIGNFNSEMPRQSRTVMAALGASNLVPIDQVFEDKRVVLEKALEDKPAYLLRVPKALPPDEASDLIVEHIQDIIALAGI